MSTETNPTLHTWQKVALHTYRLAVPGGWLYRHDVVGYSADAGRNVITHAMMTHAPDPTAPHVIAAERAIKREAQAVRDRHHAEDAARRKAETDRDSRRRSALHDYLTANWTDQGGGAYMLPTEDGRWICQHGYSGARARLYRPDGPDTLSAELNWSGLCFGAVDDPAIAPLVAIIRGTP